MHQAIAAIITALAYASFSDADLKVKVDAHLEALGEDLDTNGADYVPGVEVEGTEKDLSAKLNEIDWLNEELDSALENADNDAAEDEAEG